MAFNPVGDAIAKLITPLAEECRGFSETLVELLQGITAEQRRTNELLTEIREIERVAAGTKLRGTRWSTEYHPVAGRDRAARPAKEIVFNEDPPKRGPS